VPQEALAELVEPVKWLPNYWKSVVDGRAASSGDPGCPWPTYCRHGLGNCGWGQRELRFLLL
jgi:hypothetical protein